MNKNVQNLYLLGTNSSLVLSNPTAKRAFLAERFFNGQLVRGDFNKSSNLNLNCYNFIFLSKFHTSVSLYSDKGLSKAVELEKSNSLNEKVNMSEKEILEMKQSLLEFKEKLSKSQEVSQEVENVKNYLSNNDSISSFEEAFPNYIKKTDLNKEIGEVDKVEEKFSMILEEFNKVLKKCKEENIKEHEDCLKQIKMSDIIKKAYSKENPEEVIIEGLVKRNVNQIIEKIGNTTVKEVYDTILDKFINNQIALNVKVEYLEIAANLVSYGILLRSYNRFIHNRPFPSSYNADDLKLARQVRGAARIYFAGMIAPFMLFFFHQIRVKNPIISVNVELNKNENNSIFLLLFRTALNSSSTLNQRVIMFILIIYILIFLI